MDLVILAGGKGTRIKHQNPYLPKPMVKFNKISFLQLIINHYSKFNFKNIFIIAGYKGSLIKKKFNNKIQNFSRIKCFVEKKPMDTAGALNLIKNKINEDFILINGDTFIDIHDVELLVNNSKNSLVTMGLIKSSKKNIKFNNLFLDNKKNVVKKKSNLINAGIYYLKKNIFNLIKNKPLSIENYLLPKILEMKKLKGVLLKNFFIDIGTPEDLKKAKEIIPKKFTKPAVFLDRDGVINYDKGYTYKFSEFRFRKNILKFLKKLNNTGYYIFIISNQAGIAKKKFSINDFYKLHQNIKEYLLRKKIYINDVEFCPHHPLGKIKKYRKRCKCRKPSNQMIKNIEARWMLKKSNSFFIGDQKKDKLAAEKSKLKFYFVKNDIFKQWKLINKN